MSSSEVRTPAGDRATKPGVDMKLEVVVIPVSDVDRAKKFYELLGWRTDADVDVEGFKLVQLTPPGSSCSIQFGTDVTPAPPGSATNSYLVVSDIDQARRELGDHGVDVSKVFHEASLGDRFLKPGSDGRVEGASPDGGSYRSFASFSDPDGNTWLLQEITTRLPGRVDAEATYESVDGLAGALRRAAAAHGEHEKRIGKADPDWPDWYAAYMLAEQTGTDPPP